MNDDELLAAFEKGSLPFEHWSHRAHVRVAYLYALQHDFESATNHLRDQIKAYNKATGTPDAIDRGYHETITVGFMHLVLAAIAQTGPHESSDKFCESHPELLSKHALNEYYSREVLMAWEAKARFVAPDRTPLPSPL